MADWDSYIKRSEAAKRLAEPVAEVITEVVSYFENEWQAMVPEGAVGMVLEDLASTSAF